MSYENFLDVSPYELGKALDDHFEYHNIHIREFEILVRSIGVTMRNKGLKGMYQIKDPRRFFRFFWERVKEVVAPTRKDWKRMDKKYGKRKGQSK